MRRARSASARPVSDSSTPFGPRARTLRGKSFEEIARAEDQSAMDAISIDAVEAAALETLHAGGLR